MKGYSTFPRAPGMKPHHHIDKCHIQDTHWGGVLPTSAEMQSVYSTTPANCTGVTNRKMPYIEPQKHTHNVTACMLFETKMSLPVKGLRKILHLESSLDFYQYFNNCVTQKTYLH